MKYVLTNDAGRPDNAFFIVKLPIRNESRHLLPNNQIKMSQMLEALTELGDIANLSCTPFIRSLKLVQLNVLTSQVACNAQITGDYLESLGLFIH